MLSYSLEVDDGAGGAYKVLYGLESDTLSLSFVYREVKRGFIYRARYRVRNAIGWSDYSPVSSLLAASPP